MGAYEIPENLLDGTFVKHVLASGFKTKFAITPGAASPGFAYGFYPRANSEGPKHILLEADVGGTVGALLIRDLDGDGIMDVLVANNDDSEITFFTFVEEQVPIQFV